MTEPDFSDPRRPEHRLAYRAAVDRPRLAFPGGQRVAIWPVVNVEHWLIDNPMPRQILVAPTGASLLPDLPNWAWHEYGMRVGFWRILAAFAARGLHHRGSPPHRPLGTAARRVSRSRRRLVRARGRPRGLVSGHRR